MSKSLSASESRHILREVMGKDLFADITSELTYRMLWPTLLIVGAFMFLGGAVDAWLGARWVLVGLFVVPAIIFLPLGIAMYRFGGALAKEWKSRTVESLMERGYDRAAAERVYLKAFGE